MQDVRTTVRTNPPCRWSRLGAAGILLIATLVYFRVPVLSGFRRIGGYADDTRLAVFLHEHWCLVAAGQRSWLEPGYYWPVGNLGATDTFALNSVLYVPLRQLGVEPFLAFVLTSMIVFAIGLVSFYMLLRQAFGLAPLASATLSASGTYTSALFLQVGHPQLTFVNWIFFCALLGWRAATTNRNRSAGYGFATGLVAGLVLFSTFYVAWFTIAALAVALGTITLVDAVRTRLRSTRHTLRKHRTALVAGCTGTLPGLAAFLATYLPTYQLGKTRSDDLLELFRVGPSDLANVGDQNLLAGWLHGPNESGLLGREALMGLPPVLLGCTVVAIASLWIVSRRRRRRIPTRLIGMIVAFLSLLAAPVEVFDLTLWSSIRTLVPGAMAIRVPARAWVVAAPTSVLCIAAALSQRRDPYPRWARLAGAIAGAALLVGNISTDTQHRLDRSNEQALIALGERAPEDCTTLLNVGQTDHPGAWNAHLDAMIVSIGSETPTVNGYGFDPAGFPTSVGEPGFHGAALAWASANDALEGLCVVDVKNARWHDSHRR